MGKTGKDGAPGDQGKQVCFIKCDRTKQINDLRNK